MSIDVEVNASIDIICELCGEELEVNQNTNPMFCNYGKIGVEPCTCQKDEIEELRQEVEQLRREYES